MDLIRKKIYVTTGIKILIALMFIGFGMTAGILTGAVQNFSGYIKGYKAEYITSLKDFENIKMYNTKIIEVENIKPTNIKYYDGFSKKRNFSEGGVKPQGEYYLAEFQGIVIFLMGNKEDFVLKKNGKYEVKGRLEILSNWFIENKYTKLVYSMDNPQALRPFAVNAVSPWKIEGACYYTLFILLGIPALIFFLKYVKDIITISRHSTYRNLAEFGNWIELKMILENEIKTGKYEEYESQIITKNFLVIKNYYSLKIIPITMIVNSCVEYGIKRKRWTMGRITFLLLNGEIVNLFRREKKVKKIVKWLENNIFNSSIEEGDSINSITFEYLLKMREFWNGYLKRDSTPLISIENKENNEIKEYMETIRKELKKNI